MTVSMQKCRADLRMVGGDRIARLPTEKSTARLAFAIRSRDDTLMTKENYIQYFYLSLWDLIP